MAFKTEFYLKKANANMKIFISLIGVRMIKLMINDDMFVIMNPDFPLKMF